MIGYFDTSALVPLLIDEPTSAACRRFWDDSDSIVTSQLSYVEAASALAAAHRLRRISASTLAGAVERLDDLWSQLAVIEVDDLLVHRAAQLAQQCGLRGYDAVHCASAEQCADPALVSAAGDNQLLNAWSSVGVATFNTNAS